MTDRVAVVGAGQMGNGIAHVFALAGHPVTMIDVSPDALAKGRATIEKNMDRQLKKGTIDQGARDAALGRLTSETDLELVREYPAQSPHERRVLTALLQPHVQPDARIGRQRLTADPLQDHRVVPPQRWRHDQQAAKPGGILLGDGQCYQATKRRAAHGQVAGRGIDAVLRFDEGDKLFHYERAVSRGLPCPGMVPLGWRHFDDAVLTGMVDPGNHHRRDPSVFDEFRHSLSDLPCLTGSMSTVGVKQILAVVKDQERASSRVQGPGFRVRFSVPRSSVQLRGRGIRGPHGDPSWAVDPERRHIVAVHEMN